MMENQEIAPTAPSADNPYFLYPEELGRTFGDAMKKCTLEQRAHYVACQRVILNFDLATVRRHLDEVERRLTRNYSLGQVEEAHADLRTIERLRSIEAQHIAKSAHVDRLDWYLGTTATHPGDDSGHGKEMNSELLGKLPLPLQLVDMTTVNTARVERTTPQSPHSDSGVGNAFPKSPFQMSPIRSQQPSMEEPEYSKVQLQRHLTANTQPSNDQWERSSRLDSGRSTTRSTCGDWESDGDHAPIPVEADTVPAAVPAREAGLLVDLGGSGLPAVSANTDKYNALDRPSNVAWISKSMNTTPPPTLACANEAIQHQPGCRLMTKSEKSSREDLVDQSSSPAQERKISMRMNRIPDSHIPLVFRYGVQYVPKTSPSHSPGAQRGNYECHAVVISSIPEEAQMKDILPRVRGGRIVRSSLVHTAPHGMGLTAFVTFANWKEAHEYTNFAKKNPQLITVLGHQVTVELANTPTYPARWIQLGLDNSLSRCVEFRLSQSKCYRELFRYIQTRFKNIWGSLEDAWVNESNMVVFLFRNIEDAIRAHDIIGLGYQDKNECDVLRYGGDPCSEGFDYLQHLAYIALARGDYPSITDEYVNKDSTDQAGRMTVLSPPQAITRRSSNHQPPTSTEDGNICDMVIFKPGEESLNCLRSYSLEQYCNKYGYSEYIKSHEEWLEAWPYVGDFEQLEPQQYDKSRNPKAYVPNDNGPLQDLIG